MSSLGDELAYATAGLVGAWGIAHVIPTKNVVAGFGELSKDNRLVITMEWIAEGLALTFLGVLVALVTAQGGSSDHVASVVYSAIAGMLLVMGALTAVTGARTSVVLFRFCPVVKATAAVLLLIAVAL